MFIRKVLVENNIEFEEHKIFPECRNVLPLPFDFYLPDFNLLIEFDGIQHFKAIERFGGEDYLQKLKLHDKIKTDFAKKKNIDLMRIPYTISKETIKEKLIEVFTNWRFSCKKRNYNTNNN